MHVMLAPAALVSIPVLPFDPTAALLYSLSTSDCAFSGMMCCRPGPPVFLSAQLLSLVWSVQEDWELGLQEHEQDSKTKTVTGGNTCTSGFTRFCSDTVICLYKALISEGHRERGQICSQGRSNL